MTSGMTVFHGGSRRHVAGLRPADEPGANRKARGENAGADALAQVRTTVPVATIGTCFPGSAATIRRRTIPALPASAAEAVATVEAVMVLAVAAINAESPGKSSVIHRNDTCLDSFQYLPRHQFGIA